MHMSDALLSPAVGGAFWVVSGGLIAYAAKKIKSDGDESKIPFMGVTSAFVFAAQMINISIPGTGSSGHLGGGLLLAILLGPHRAFIAMASILTIQCLMFADGGLMALGANIFNMGFLSAYIIYPFIYKPLVSHTPGKARFIGATMFASILILVGGAIMVVIQTVSSGLSDLPFGPFLSFMAGIHFGIGILEGLVTTGVLLFIQNFRPEQLNLSFEDKIGIKKVTVVLLFLAIITGGFVSWYASENPDGLEWSVLKVSGKEEPSHPKSSVRKQMENAVEKTAVFPDYNLKSEEAGTNMGQSFAAIVGMVLVFGLAVVFGIIFRKKNKPIQPVS